MSEPKHSPGPWRANLPRRSDRALLASHVVNSAGITIAQLAHHSDEIIEANAHLIAAAPDLLAAAKRSLTIIHSFVDLDNEHVKKCLANLQAAIARAEGASP